MGRALCEAKYRIACARCIALNFQATPLFMFNLGDGLNSRLAKF